MQIGSFVAVLALASVVYGDAELSNDMFFTAVGNDAVAVDFSVFIEPKLQRFSDASTRVNTIGFDSRVQWRGLSFIVELPWQSIDGAEYVNSNSQAVLPQVCQNIGQLTPTQLAAIASRKNITQILNACDTLSVQATSPRYHVSGLADIFALVTAGRSLDRHGLWYGDVLLGAKWDNADTDEGLGSGTRELILETRLERDDNNWRVGVTLGSNVFIGGVYQQQYDDYVYASVDISTRISRLLRFKAAYSWQQSASDFSDDIESVDIGINIYPHRDLILNVGVKDYLSPDNYPEYELKSGLTYYF